MSTWRKWIAQDVSFESEGEYGNPYTALDLKMKLYAPDGSVTSVDGFWNGGRRWKVRIAPWMVGEWKWETYCTGVKDGGLDGKRGSFSVELADCGNDRYIHGGLKIHESRRGFAHDDDTPFFWLGDTVWSISANAELKEWKEYLSFRKSQGFNIAQINVLPQWDASVYEGRRPFTSDEGKYSFDHIEPDYFQYLDTLISECVRSGIVPALVALWFNYVPGANLGWSVEMERHPMMKHEIQRYIRYVVARYAAFGPVWLISGDTDYERDETIEAYDVAAETILECSPTKPLITAHLNGGLSTPRELNERHWLDFHMFQSCHFFDSDRKAIQYATQDRAYAPKRPVLNGEPCYDHLRFLDEGNSEDKKIGRDFVRKVAWTSILCGANAGITYGAHGLWPWHRHGEPYRQEFYGKPLPWETALRLESGNDMAILKRFFDKIDWWDLQPSPQILGDAQDGVAASSTGQDTIVIYSPTNEPLRLLGDYSAFSATWINPATEQELEAYLIPGGVMTVIEGHPWSQDGVLRMERCHQSQ